MWYDFKDVLYFWWCKNRVSCGYVSVMGLSPHSTISAFILLLFPCCRHSNNHAWLFFPAHISQMGPEMGIFPPSWWYTCRSCGRFKEMAASLCFLGAGCGPLLYLALAQQLLRQAQEHLGHPYSVLPTCAHSHRMIKVGGSQLTRVQGSGPDWKKIGALCQCGSYNMSYSGSQGLSSQAQQLSQAWLEASWPQAHTQTQKRTRGYALRTANTASWCYIKAEQGC